MVVERRLQPEAAGEGAHALEVLDEGRPRAPVRLQAGAPAGAGAARRVAGVGQGGPGRRPVLGAREQGEVLEHGQRPGQRGVEPGVVPGQGQVDPRPAQQQAAPGERVGQGPSRPEQAAGPQVDGVVPGRGDGVEQLAARGRGDELRPGEVEDPVGHGGVGNSDHGSPADMRGATSSGRRRHYSEVQIKSCQARPPTVTAS